MTSISRSIQVEEEPVRQAAKGDVESFNQLMLTHRNMAYNHALLGDAALAEDATQESFIKAFQGMQSFRGGSFRSWLLKIVTKSAFDILRRARRRPTRALFPVDEDGEEIESAAWLVDPNASIQSTVEQKELSREIYKVLDELHNVYRSELTIIDMHDLDYTGAAQALNIPISTVKSRLARTRIQMRDKLRDITSHLGGPHSVNKNVDRPIL